MASLWVPDSSLHFSDSMASMIAIWVLNAVGDNDGGLKLSGTKTFQISTNRGWGISLLRLLLMVLTMIELLLLLLLNCGHGSMHGFVFLLQLFLLDLEVTIKMNSTNHFH